MKRRSPIEEIKKMNETFRVMVDGSEYTFSSSHFLVLGDGKTTEPLHGHDYRAAVEVVGGIDPATGWVVDFLVLQSIVSRNVRPLDHKILIPDRSPHLEIHRGDDLIEIVAPDRRWSFPAGDCLLLPMQATTTELLSHCLAASIHKDLVDRGAAFLESTEVTLEESGGFRASCRIDGSD